MMEVRGIEKGVERVAMMFFKRSIMEMVGGDRDIDGLDR